ITALDQSIVVGDQTIGISLDKYLGKDYELYKKYNYSESQLQTMSRENIVPDCLNFYLLSLYPMKDFEASSQQDRDIHFSKILWVCNMALDNDFFKSSYIDLIEKYMSKNKQVDIESLLKNEDYSVFL
ncbi:MAG: gliding motility protein GldB, partial [Prevotella sp.]|nr:gliding motility protein GldB [Prevotella sp.]